MGVCSAGNCRNRHATGFVVCRFPKEPVRKETWRQIVAKSRQQPNWQPTDSSRVCEVHFKPDQWKVYRKTLENDAVPDIFCFCSPSKKDYSVHCDHTYARSLPCNLELSSSSTSSRAYLADNTNTLASKPLRSRVIEQHSHLCPFHPDSRDRQKLVENFHLKKQICLARQESERLQEEEKNLLHCCEVLQKLNEEGRKPNDQWDTSCIKKGLKMWFAGGASGYRTTSTVSTSPLPGIRTLQRRIEHIKFQPGLQSEFLLAVGKKLQDVSDSRDRDASIIFDEMALQCRREYDLGTKSISGLATLPGRETRIATKCQIYLLKGCHRKWKQIVGYNFLDKDGCGPEVGKVLRDLCLKAEEQNINVVCIVCDMGNRSVLADLGFQTSKNGMIFKIKNPANLSKEIRCLPDPIHVIKACKECIISNSFITLPDRIVEAFALPSDRVELEHLEWLNDFQENEEFKIAPRLQLKDINAKHFRKMNAKSALHVFSHPVACGLRYLVEKDLVPVQVETTAWFIKIFNRFVELVTSRNPAVAFSTKVPEEYEKAKAHLRLVADVFQHMKVGEKGVWKPVQTHVIMICECLLDLQEYLLKERKYDFVFTGRFSQDTVENTISLVRMNRVKCSAMEAKYRLRQLAFSQCQQKIKGSSYEFDRIQDCVDLLLSVDNERTPKSLPAVDTSKFEWKTSVPVGAYHHGQEDILYRVCGYVIHSLISSNQLQCSECIASLRNNEEYSHPHSALLKIMNFKEGAQIEVSDEVFQILRLIDFNIRLWRPKLETTQAELSPLVMELILPGVSDKPLSTCHDVKSVLAKKFSFMKLKMSSKLMQTEEVQNSTVFQASPSLAGGHFVATYQPGQYQKPSTTRGKKRIANADEVDPDDPLPLGTITPSVPKKRSQGLRRLAAIP